MKKKLKLSFNAPVTLTFVLLCFVAVGLSYLTKGWTEYRIFMTYRSSLTDPLTYVRAFAHVLGHGDFAHLFSNISYLLLLGPVLEERYGSKRVIIIIIITALLTGIANNLFFPNSALLGASGIVFAFIILTSFSAVKDGKIPVTFILVAVCFIGQQIYDGIKNDDNISYISHILGGVTGLVAGFIFNSRKKYTRSRK